MKLEKVLDGLNSFEKNSFLKIIDNIVADEPRNMKQIDKILSDTSKDLKNVDNINIARVFALIEEEYKDYVSKEFEQTDSQLDVLIDIIIRDGNCIMSREWFARLYEAEIKHIKKKLKGFKVELESEKPTIEASRIRDYKVYKACVDTAYYNDVLNNQESKITNDEHSVLRTLANSLELSQEEVKLINYSILPIHKLDIDTIINDLKNIGVLFYSKKGHMTYIPDEVVRVLRIIRNKEVADKFSRRVLKLLKDPQINLVCKKHNIDRKLDRESKLREIINEGISFSGILKNDIFKEGTKVTEKKSVINALVDKGLNISPALRGARIEEKIENLIAYFEEIEKDEKVGISIDGYEKMLHELGEKLPKLNKQLKAEFELQDENTLHSDYLLDYNIKPRDVLEVLTNKELEHFCKSQDIKTRGNLVLNILDNYKDSENLYLENYEHFGTRNLNELKENGIKIKESELGLKFEDLTRTILSRLGFNVDEGLRKQLNTKKDKIDIVINLGGDEVILVECKTVKESGYNRFSSVSRQIKSYINLAKLNDYKVIKSLLIAPDFSDVFINDCELEYELNLSLISASSLLKILEGFKNSKHKEFPYKLLMRDVLIQEDRVIKAISR